MAKRDDLEFTYTQIDRIFRLSLGELADFSGAKYDGDFSLSLEEAQRRKHCAGPGSPDTLMNNAIMPRRPDGAALRASSGVRKS